MSATFSFLSIQHQRAVLACRKQLLSLCSRGLSGNHSQRYNDKQQYSRAYPSTSFLPFHQLLKSFQPSHVRHYRTNRPPPPPRPARPSPSFIAYVKKLYPFHRTLGREQDNPASPAASSPLGASDPTAASSPIASALRSSPPDANLDSELSEVIAQSPPLPSPLYEEKKILDSLIAVEIDVKGNMVEKEYSRAGLARRFALNPRDIRFLDSSLRNLPSLLVRDRVILVNLELFKAIISAHHVIIFDYYIYPTIQDTIPVLQQAVRDGHVTAINNGTSPYAALYDEKKEAVEELDKEEEINEENAPMPFEFITLEIILMTVTRALESRYEYYTSALSPHLLASTTVSSLNEGSTLLHLLQLKNGLTAFEVVLKETAAALRAVLTEDIDMARMYLTERSNGVRRNPARHEEVEVLLETYERKVEELENEVKTNVKSITLTEDHIQIRLDSSDAVLALTIRKTMDVRNSMMRLALLLEIFTFAVASGAFAASIFGMNLNSQFETTPYGLWIAAGSLILLTILIIRNGLRWTAKHKIDLFHIPIDGPELRFPNSLSKYKRQLSKRHSIVPPLPTPNDHSSSLLLDQIPSNDQLMAHRVELKLKKLKEVRAKNNLEVIETPTPRKQPITKLEVPVPNPKYEVPLAYSSSRNNGKPTSS